MPLFQSQVVQNLQASSIRKIRKEMGKTKETGEEPSKEIKSQILRNKNGFFK